MNTSEPSPRKTLFFFGRRLTVRQLLTFGRSRAGLMSFLGVATLVALMVTAASHGRPTAEALQQHVLPVETMTLERVDSYEVPRWYTGAVRARRRTNLSFMLPGKIESVEVDEGDRVSIGSVLAKLETNRLQARKRGLEAQRDEAAARLAELVAGPRTETIAAAEAEVRDLAAQLKLQQANHERHEKLFSDAIITQEEFDTSRFGVQAAAARVDVASRKLDELKAGTRKEQIDAQRAVVAQLDAQLTNVAIDIDDSVL